MKINTQRKFDLAMWLAAGNFLLRRVVRDAGPGRLHRVPRFTSSETERRTMARLYEWLQAEIKASKFRYAVCPLSEKYIDEAIELLREHYYIYVNCQEAFSRHELGLKQWDEMTSYEKIEERALQGTPYGRIRHILECEGEDE